jgi:putative aldouronate transport system permease protein
MMKQTSANSKKAKGRFREDLRRNWVLWLMLAPALCFFVINNYLPMVGVYFAFTKFNFRGGIFGSPFVGLANFAFLWKSQVLVKLTVNTVLYNFVFISLGNVLQVAVAILISQMASRIFKRLTQTLIFMPYFVSFVIFSVLVYNIFNYEFGLANNVLKTFGAEPVNFYGEPLYWPFFITFFHLWKSLGYGVVVYLATILGINKEYYEAARVDGATVTQQIRYITLPQLAPTFTILLLFSIGHIMRGQFELFYQIIGNNGLLFSTTDIIDTYVYRSLTTTFDFGMGTAAGLYQSVFGFILVMTVNIIVKRKDPAYALF